MKLIKATAISVSAERGLRAIRSLASIEIDSGEAGCFAPSNGGKETDAVDVSNAIAWLDRLLEGAGK